MAWYSPLTNRIDIISAIMPDYRREVVPVTKTLSDAISSEDDISNGSNNGSIREEPSPVRQFLTNFFFPLKPDGQNRYGWTDIPVRWFLGETKDQFYDLALESYSNSYPNASEVGLVGRDAAMVQTINSLHSFRENFLIGRGPNQGKLNIAAFFNPFNYARALDNFFINNGLRMLAFARNANLNEHDINSHWGFIARGFTGLMGLAFIGVGAALRLPRVLVQYCVSASTKPIWNFVKHNATHETKIPYLSWKFAAAVVLTLINFALVGLTVGGAAPAVSVISDAASKAIGTLASTTASTITATAVNDQFVTPAGNMLSSAVSHLTPALDLAPAAYLQVFPGADNLAAAALVGTTTGLGSRMILNGGYTIKPAVESRVEDKGFYADHGYRAKTPSLSS